MVWGCVSIFLGFSGRQATSSGSFSPSPEKKVLPAGFDYNHLGIQQVLPSYWAPDGDEEPICIQ